MQKEQVEFITEPTGYLRRKYRNSETVPYFFMLNNSMVIRRKWQPYDLLHMCGNAS